MARSWTTGWQRGGGWVGLGWVGRVGRQAGARLACVRPEDFEMRKLWKKHLTAAVICDRDILLFWLTFPARPELALLSQLIEGPPIGDVPSWARPRRINKSRLQDICPFIGRLDLRSICSGGWGGGGVGVDGTAGARLCGRVFAHHSL